MAAAEPAALHPGPEWEPTQAYHGWLLVVLLKELGDQSPLRVEVLLGGTLSRRRRDASPGVA